MKQRTAGWLTLLALCSGLAACSRDVPEDDGGPTYAFGSGDTYVALGDSYTAAPNTGPLAARDGCFQTLHNYPHRVAEATGMTLRDNSCAGASTNSLTHEQPTVSGPHPPQLSGLDEDTDLVTLRLGANDYALFGRILQCARIYGDRTGTPCSDIDAALGERGSAARLQDVEANLVQGLRDIRARAPEAEIVVIGYPRVFPEDGTTCPLLPFPADDHDFGRRLFAGLNAALEAAAAEEGAAFIDVDAASADHDICADDPWIAGAKVIGGRATPWHPYAGESQAVAALLLAELEQ